MLEGEKRTEVLKFSLEKINFWMESNLRKVKFNFNTVFKYLYKGILWPICPNQKKMILGVVKDLAHCFSTKSRTPIKIVFEIIDINELDEWENNVHDEAYSKQSESISIPSKAININRDEVEKIKANKINAFKDFAKNILKQEKKMKKKAKNENRISCLEVQEKGFPGKKTKDHKDESPIRYFDTEGDADKDVDWMQYRITEKAIEHIINKFGTKQQEKLFDPPIVEDSGNEATQYIPLEARLEGMKDPFGEKWSDIVLTSKNKSKFGKFRSYELKSIIVKTNDNLKQEQLAMQVLTRFKQIYSEAKIPIFIGTYNIIVTSLSSGFIGKIIQIA